VSGCFHNHALSLDGVEAVRIDFQTSSLSSALANADPDVVVHCAGMTDVDACEDHPELARFLNQTVASAVADVCAARSIRLVHISTDHFFDGSSPFATEETVPKPVNVYGATKLAGERAVAERCPQALIIRTNFFGWGLPHRRSFSDWVLDVLSSGRAQPMFSDVYFTPILIQDLMEILLDLMDRGAAGIFHVAGAERLSKFDFARAMAKHFNLSPDNLIRASIEESGLRAARPREMSLSSGKMEALLHRNAPSVSDGLRRLAATRDRSAFDLN
jgi:dTDP-4-dehydrorhamnose reductase